MNISFKDNKKCNMTLILINLYGFYFIIVSQVILFKLIISFTNVKSLIMCV